MEGPPPTIDCGLVWFDQHPSPALPAFLDLTREIIEAAPDPADGRLSLTEV